MDSGLLFGKSLDPLGISHEAVDAWSKNGITSVEYWFEGFKNSIKKHFEKITNPKNGKPPALRSVHNCCAKSRDL